MYADELTRLKARVEVYSQEISELTSSLFKLEDRAENQPELGFPSILNLLTNILKTFTKLKKAYEEYVAELEKHVQR